MTDMVVFIPIYALHRAMTLTRGSIRGWTNCDKIAQEILYSSTKSEESTTVGAMLIPNLRFFAKIRFLLIATEAIGAVYIIANLTGCIGHTLNPCAQYLVSEESPIVRSSLLEPADSSESPAWQPQPGEWLLGAANGKAADEALLQFQKEPGGPSLRYINPTRIYRYKCSSKEMSNVINNNQVGYNRTLMNRQINNSGEMECSLVLMSVILAPL